MPLLMAVPLPSFHLQAPYSDLLPQIPRLLRGPAAGGAEAVFLLIRLEDMVIVHPESRHAPVTKKKKMKKEAGEGEGAPDADAGDVNTTAELASLDDSAPISAETKAAAERDFREKYGCARLEDAETQLTRAVEHLAQLVEDADSADVAIHILVFPPPPPDVGEHTKEWAEAAAVAEKWLCDRVASATTGRVRVTPSADILKGIAIGVDWYDRRMDRLAHAPYTPAVFRVVAESCIRTLHRLVLQSAPKVAVLDCDNTLWGGAVAELGSAGVAITEPYLGLQRFFAHLQDQGTLICLCSRNTKPDDVLQVWRDREDEMVLKLDHIVAHWVSMSSKSTGLRHLADTLCLGVDSLVLIDDSATECAEVSATLPQVGVLQLPRDPTLYSRFLERCWLFDPGFSGAARTTAVDAVRTKLYRQVAQRSEAFGDFEGDLPAWVASLGIAIAFGAVDPESVDRAAQLTERTSQMNACKRPVTASALLQRCADGPNPDLVQVTVRDRFGDHGVVGLMVLAAEASRPTVADAASTGDDAPHTLEVDAFLLSCRSLHLGVEHAMMRHLAAIAVERECTTIRLQWRPSERNDAACHFFARIPGAQFVATPYEGAAPPDAADDKQAASDASVPTRPSSADSPPAIAPARDHPSGRTDTNLQYMTPELEDLSKRDRKRELRRRAREAQRMDASLAEIKKEARNARRAASRDVNGRVEQVSQHQAFNDKPPPGYIDVPVSSARDLCVSMGTRSRHSVSAGGVTPNGVTEAEPALPTRVARVTADGRAVALHHETMLAVGLGLTARTSDVHSFIIATHHTPVEQMLGGGTNVPSGVGEAVGGGGGGDDSTDQTSLEMFRDYCAKREQARDIVKVMIQEDNPDSYDHVNHLKRETIDS
jgi:FkbH-like protein